MGILAAGGVVIGGGLSGAVSGVAIGGSYSSIWDSINKIIALRDKYANSGQFPKRYAKYDCESKKKREAKEAQAGNNNSNPVGIISLAIMSVVAGVKYINSTIEKLKKEYKGLKKFTGLIQHKEEEDSMKLINISNGKLEKLGA